MTRSEVMRAWLLVVATCLVIGAAVVIVDASGGPKIPWIPHVSKSDDTAQEATRVAAQSTSPASDELATSDEVTDESIDLIAPDDADPNGAVDSATPAGEPAQLFGDLILPMPIVGRISVPRPPDTTSTAPPLTTPPITLPPVTVTPTTAPPTTEPPTTEPPTTDPPVTDPPVTDPPVTDPPATDPPSTDVSAVPDVTAIVHDLIDLLLP